MKKIKEFIRNKQALMYIFSMIYSLLGFNWISGIRGLSIKKKCAFLWKTKITNHGKNNEIIFETGCRVYNCKIVFWGNNNTVKFDHDCECKDMDIWISDGGLYQLGIIRILQGKFILPVLRERKLVSENGACSLMVLL